MTNRNTEHAPSVVRRGLLAGAGAASLGILGALSTAGPAAAAEATEALPVLFPGDDWAATLAVTSKVQLVAGATYTLQSTVVLPSNTLIEGNGAIVTVASNAMGAFTSTSTTAVTLRNITFQGQTADPLNLAPKFGHVALKFARCTNYRVADCDFINWLGAGIAVTGSTGEDYFSYRGQIQGNTFHRCYFGVSLADRAEYSLLINNVFTTNRLAIWNSSGNWNIVGNTAVNCYGAYYSFAKSSPYGALNSDNWNHGAVVSNTFNHSNGSGGARWTGNSNFPIGGVSSDPGAGIVIDGLLPPTFTGNTLWYTNIRANNHLANQWMLTGCALSNLSISCTGNNPIKILGYQSNGTTNAPVLTGNVSSLI